MKKTDIMLEKMMTWFMNRQIREVNNGSCGMFPAWIDFETKASSFGYSEITGYALSLNSFLCCTLEPETVKRLRIEDSAELSYRWIRDHFSENGFLKTRILYGDISPYLNKTSNLRYLFDSGMILNGLVNYAQLTGSEKVSKTAYAVADYIMKEHFEGGENILPVKSYEGDEYYPNPLKWSVQKTTYLGKVAIGFAYLHSLTGESDYLPFLDSLVNLLKSSISAKGIFKSYNEQGRLHFHPLLYAVEAAFCLGEIFKDTELTNLAVNNLDFAFGFQNKNGELPSLIWDDHPIYAFRSDIHFQAIRMAAVIDYKAQSKRFADNRGRALEFVLENHIWENEIEAAAWYGIDAEPLEGAVQRKREHLNVWATMFAIQAMVLHENVPALNYFISHPTFIV